MKRGGRDSGGSSGKGRETPPTGADSAAAIPTACLDPKHGHAFVCPSCRFIPGDVVDFILTESAAANPAAFRHNDNCPCCKAGRALEAEVEQLKAEVREHRCVNDKGEYT